MANKGSCDNFDKVVVLTISENFRVNLCAKKRFYGTQIKYATFCDNAGQLLPASFCAVL